MASDDRPPAAAIDDARAFSVDEYGDDPTADLLLMFYRYAAGFHCAYRELHA